MPNVSRHPVGDWHPGYGGEHNLSFLATPHGSPRTIHLCFLEISTTDFLFARKKRWRVGEITATPKGEVEKWSKKTKHFGGKSSIYGVKIEQMANTIQHLFFFGGGEVSTP